LPNGKENGKKPGVFCASAGALLPVAGGGEPLLGSGAGVGSGMLSAKTFAVPRQPKTNPQTTATTVFAGPSFAGPSFAGLSLAAPLPAISLSADTSAHAPNALTKSLVQEDDGPIALLLFAAYGEFAAAGLRNTTRDSQ
jgi:hypothetical protein